MLAVYAAALATLAASVVVGHAVRLVCLFPRSRWLAPAVGFATVLATEAAAVELGGGTTALVLLVLLLVAALGVVAVRRTWSPLGWEAAPVAPVVLLLVALPFLANDRVGVLGMGNSNDTVDHLVGAHWLASGEGIVPRVVFYGYPLGPDALASAFTTLGTPLPEAFTGIMFAAPVLTAMAALAVLPERPTLVRLGAAVLAGIPYLVASYFAQGEVNEVIVGVFVLAFALAVRELAAEPSPRRLRTAAPLGLLAAGMVSTYSYLGLVWPLTLLGFLLLVHLVLARPSPLATVRRVVVRAGPLALVAALVFAASAGAQASRIARFADAPYANTPQERMGNLIDPISPLTVLGVWPTTEVRAYPEHRALAALAGVVALTAFVLAVAWWVRRRDATVLAALAACALVYAQASLVKNPYAAAKALPVAAPLVMLALAVPWLETWRARAAAGTAGTRRRAAAVVGAGGVFALVAAASSAATLRDAYVGTNEQGAAIEALRPHVVGERTLFIGYDDFAHWYLRGAELATIGRLYSRWVSPRRPEKQWTKGQAFDFDTVPREMLDAVRYVVAPRSPYTSSAPRNFALREENRWYRLWERAGPTPDRLLPVGEVGAPGARLDCDGADAAALESGGRAAVLPAPVVGHTQAWDGRPDEPRTSTSQVLQLSAGRWDLSLQYANRRPLRISAPGLDVTMPATLARVGPHWLVGTVDLARPTRLRVTVETEIGFAARVLDAGTRTRAYGSPAMLPLGELVATPSPWAPRLVPVERACGRYVDWYAPRER